MDRSAVAACLIVAATVLAMEWVAFAVHKYVMHGWGWGWHRSHHEPRTSWFEANDLYAIIFAAISVGLFAAGGRWPALYWIGVGTAVYGLLYGFVHDGLVHQRFPVRIRAMDGYLKRLVQAHRLHHATQSREGAVSFGFLYAPPVRSLVVQVRSQRRQL